MHTDCSANLVGSQNFSLQLRELFRYVNDVFIFILKSRKSLPVYMEIAGECRAHRLKFDNVPRVQAESEIQHVGQ